MKANELRIGNWVKKENGYIIEVDISHISDQYLHQMNRHSGYKPIPLTEEWLVKFGFDTDKITWWLNGVTLGDYKDGFWFIHGSLSNRTIQIKHVHQLQNFYFALTNEELTIK